MAHVDSEDKLQKKIFQWLEHSQKNKFVEIDGTGVALGSAIGLVRQENQDRVLFLKVQLEGPFRRFFVAALCDGMGGMIGGEYSAKLALSVFTTSLIRSKDQKYPKKLEIAVHQANKAVFQHFSGDGGTTLSAVICDDEYECWAINVGDSRIYQVLTNGDINQLSTDDTIQAQLESLNRLDKNYPAEFRQLIQYVGMGQELEPTQFKVEFIPETNLILLTSDGIHSMPSDTFQQLTINSKDSAILIERLITHSEWIGGRDNATAIAMSINKGLGISEVDGISSGKVELWSTSGSVEIWEPSTLNPVSQMKETKLSYRDKSPRKTQEKKPQSDQQQLKKKSTPQLKIDLSNEGS